MHLFWVQGFNATSTADLVAELGVNRYSLYAEFGSKQGVFEAALQLYQSRVTGRLEKLAMPNAGVDDVLAFLEMLADEAVGPWGDRGCLLCNMATERAHVDEDTQAFVAAYVDRIRGAFGSALHNAQTRGEVRPDVDCEGQSRLLTSTVLGLWVLMRSRVDRQIVVGAARAAQQDVEGLRA